MAFTLLTDSACNLPELIIDEYQIEILPLTFFIRGEERVSYLKGEHTDLSLFYKEMRAGEVITTSLPNVADTMKLLETLASRGDDVLYLGFSSALSGTFQSVKLCMNEIAQKYPNQTFRATETLAASGGQGLIVFHAARLKAQGATLDEVDTWVRDNRLHLVHWFTVDDLMYLYRGGRVSRTSATAGTILNIKPVLHVDDEGRLIPMNKTQGRKKSIKLMFKHMKETFDPDAPNDTICITHGDCLEDAQYLEGMIREAFPQIKDVIINWVDPVIGAHSGPGTLALFYLGTQR